ncbi:helix-turn-helix domain-containing protein [Parvibaculum lavamentivorans]|uniref:helix-turn-helix domain-containing protein n=1 Tax=Parvibaculum lavamentivorans TaxID=256618 RepID=UPI001444CD16|nr:helix-turn-helix transcriptional regulator [Parvibaculum lavamentivorans]
MIEAVRARKRELGISQLSLAKRLGVSQGHLSKVLSKKALVSDKINGRMLKFLERIEEGEHVTTDQLEQEILSALRESPTFRTLVISALEMHKKA